MEGTGQAAAQVVEHLAQRLLTTGEFLGAGHLSRLLALAAPLALAGLLTLLSLLALLPLLLLLTLLLPLLLALVELALKLLEAVIRQVLLLAQGVLQFLQHLLAFLARLALLLGLHLQVLEHLAKLFQQCLGLFLLAGIGQFLDPVQKLLQLVLAEFHGVGIALGLLLVLVAHRLLRKLLHVVLHRLAQLVHQLGDFLFRRTVAERVRQPVLRPAQSFAGIRERAVLDQQCGLPEHVGNYVPVLWRESVLGHVAHAPDCHAGHQVGGAVGEQVLGRMGDGAQHLVDAAPVLDRPEEVAALFDDGARQRVEEPAAGQDHRVHRRLSGLTGGVLDGECDVHRQADPGMLRQVLDQRLLDLVQIARQRQRQVEDNLLARLGLGGQPVAAVDLVEGKRDAGLAGFDGIVVGCRVGQFHGAAYRAFDLAIQRHLGRGVRGSW